MTWTATVNPGAAARDDNSFRTFPFRLLSPSSLVFEASASPSHRRVLFLPQRQSKLQQSGGAGAAEAAGEAEGGGGGNGAHRGGAGQPAHPTSHGPQKPQQTLRGLAGLGVDRRGGETVAG